VLTVEMWQQIRHLAAAGRSRRQIARELGVSRNTVAHALAAEEGPRFHPARPQQRGLEAYAQTVRCGLRRGLSGVRLLEEVRTAGYRGSDATFYRWLASQKEAMREPQAACRFETDPGEQAQFDWSPYTLSLGGQPVKVTIYSLILAYSRRLHWFPSLSEKQEAVFEALEAGFQHFGGVCRFLVVDNARVFVTRHQADGVQFNPNFLRFCGHYAVQPIAGTPRHPQGKGKVENPFAHLERRFLVGREWRDWQHFQTELAAFEARWEMRVHGTTKVSPVERFQAEQPHLRPLPQHAFRHFVETFRQVSSDCLISYGGVRYSVPWPYAGKSVLVRQSQGRELVIYAPGGTEITRHLLRSPGTAPVVDPAHYEGLRRRQRACFQALVVHFRQQYGSLGAVAETFLQRLLARQREHPERALGQVLELLSAAPAAVVQPALADAVEFNLCSPRFLEERLRRHGAPPAGASAGAPPPALVLQLALPELDVERSLQEYGRALAPGAGGARASREGTGLEGKERP